MPPLAARIAPNWTSSAGALEGILSYLATPLPRHAVMGLTGLAFHLCLGSREDVVALPSGPADLNRGRLVERFARTGWAWQRHASRLAAGEDPDPTRAEAIEFAVSHLDQGRPLIGWDLRLHEHAVIYGYDRARGGFLVDDVLTPEVGDFAPWDAWPSSATGEIELYAPVRPDAGDPIEAIAAALGSAIEAFAGQDGPPGQPRGAAALDAWAAAFDSDVEVDRAGNAYTLAVLQTARLDGAAFLGDVAAALPELAPALTAAERALKEEGTALAPLITLFPFPTGGHGNVANPGLRRAAAMALRRSARYEREARAAIHEAQVLLEAEGG